LKKFSNRNAIDWRNWKNHFLAKIYKFGWLMAVLALDVAAVRERHCAAAVSQQRRRLCGVR